MTYSQSKNKDLSANNRDQGKGWMPLPAPGKQTTDRVDEAATLEGDNH